METTTVLETPTTFNRLLSRHCAFVVCSDTGFHCIAYTTIRINVYCVPLIARVLSDFISVRILLAGAVLPLKSPALSLSISA